MKKKPNGDMAVPAENPSLIFIQYIAEAIKTPSIPLENYSKFLFTISNVPNLEIKPRNVPNSRRYFLTGFPHTHEINYWQGGWGVLFSSMVVPKLYGTISSCLRFVFQLKDHR